MRGVFIEEKMLPVLRFMENMRWHKVMIYFQNIPRTNRRFAWRMK